MSHWRNHDTHSRADLAGAEAKHEEVEAVPDSELGHFEDKAHMAGDVVSDTVSDDVLEVTERSTADLEMVEADRIGAVGAGDVAREVAEGSQGIQNMAAAGVDQEWGSLFLVRTKSFRAFEDDTR